MYAYYRNRFVSPFNTVYVHLFTVHMYDGRAVASFRFYFCRKAQRKEFPTLMNSPALYEYKKKKM